MLSLFLNPWTFVAGALLVSTPIIIHLINRIRYRRVKWAAMEFLLKAQKRMRRRKILEQLLLLLLRCLLVFLAGILFARFVGCGDTTKETRPTAHVAILDDSPSTADAWRREDAGQTDAFNEAKKLVYERLMPAAGEATTPQTFQVIRLSETDKPFPAKAEESRVNAASIDAMEGHLRPLQASTVRRSLKDGLQRAKELLDAQAGGDTAKVIHVVSDLRAVDWAADGDAVAEMCREFKDAGITVHFVDVGHPARKPDRKSPAFSDNIGIIELKPRNRVVAVGQQTDLEVRVRNFGNTEQTNVGVAFYLNGQGNVITSLQIPKLPANQEHVQTIQVTFNRTGTKEQPLDRFNLVTAAISTPEPGGIAADNFRHAVVEVRPKLQVLVVDGRPELSDSPKGDSFYLRKLFLDSFGGIDWVAAEPARLEGMDLRPFTTIYLLNVPSLTEGAVQNVERFVRDGGGVGVFLGPNVRPDDYTSRMYRGSTGFFPVPLPSEGPSKELTPEEREKRWQAFGKRVILRDPGNRMHPALSAIYTNERGAAAKDSDVERYYLFTNIDFYWPVARRGQWREDKSVQELYCMPNETPIGKYELDARTLVDEVRKRYNGPQFDKARQYLDPAPGSGRLPLLESIRKTPAEAVSLSVLARLLDQLLCDQINDGDESEPVLREFWNQPEMNEPFEVKPGVSASVRQLATQLRDATKYGDPLYVVKQFGRGRVAVMTTDAGGTHAGNKTWTDWPSGKGSPGWVIVVSEMQKYLSGGGAEGNLSVGDLYAAEFEPGTRATPRYKPTVVRHLVTADASKPTTERKIEVVTKPLGEQPLDKPANPPEAPPDAPERPFKLAYSDARVPGAYIFTLTRLKGEKDPPGTPSEQPDFAAVAFNIDSAREGDLRRANTDDLAQWTNRSPLHNLEDLSWIDDFKQKPTDLSSRRWLYLLILLVLIAEQAWAVRISYHTRPEDLEAFAPSAAAAFSHSSASAPTAAEAVEGGEPVEKVG